MICSPRAPSSRARISSGMELQSKPKPISCMSLRMLLVGQGLDGEELLKAGDAGKGLFQALAGLADAGLVVDVEGGAVVGGDLPSTTGKRRSLKASDMGIGQLSCAKSVNLGFELM